MRLAMVLHWEAWRGRWEGRTGAMCCLGPPWEAEEPKDCKNRTAEEQFVGRRPGGGRGSTSRKHDVPRDPQGECCAHHRAGSERVGILGRKWVRKQPQPSCHSLTELPELQARRKLTVFNFLAAPPAVPRAATSKLCRSRCPALHGAWWPPQSRAWPALGSDPSEAAGLRRCGFGLEAGVCGSGLSNPGLAALE